MAEHPGPPVTERLQFDRFTASDVDALAELLADPDIARSITANASSTERRRAAAAKRIAWHNGTWTEYGYPVSALRARQASLAPPDRLLGWCGFAPADEAGEDPETLYCLDRTAWGRGPAGAAARVAVVWLFDHTGAPGVSVPARVRTLTRCCSRPLSGPVN